MELKPLNKVVDILKAFQECKGLPEEEFKLFDHIALLNDPPIQALMEIVKTTQLKPLLALTLQTFGSFSSPDVKTKLSKDIELLKILSNYAQTHASELIQWSAVKAVIGIDFGFELIIKYFSEYPQKIESNLSKKGGFTSDYYFTLYGPGSRERIKRLRELRKGKGLIRGSYTDESDEDNDELVEAEKFYISVEADYSFSIHSLSMQLGCAAYQRDNVGINDKGNMMRLVVVSPDGKHIIHNHCGNLIAVWDVAKREMLYELKAPKEGYFSDLDISADGKIIVCAEHDWDFNKQAGNILIWNVTTGRLIGSIPHGINIKSYHGTFIVNSIKISSNGEYIVAIYNQYNYSDTDIGEILIYSIYSWCVDKTFLGLSQRLVAFSPTQEVLITADSRGIVKLFSKYASERILIASKGLDGKSLDNEYLDDEHLDEEDDNSCLSEESTEECITLCESRLGVEDRAIQVRAVEFSPDGGFLVIHYEDGLLDVWNPKTWEKVYQMTEYSACFAFSPCSQVIATGASIGLIYGQIKLWRLSDGELICDSCEPIGSICSMAFTSDGKTLVTASSSGIAQTWRLN